MSESTGGSSFDKENLSSKKVAELQVIAGDMGLSQKGLKKAELIDAIVTRSSSAADASNGSGPRAPKAEPRAPKTSSRAVAGARPVGATTSQDQPKAEASSESATATTTTPTNTTETAPPKADPAANGSGEASTGSIAPPKPREFDQRRENFRQDRNERRRRRGRGRDRDRPGDRPQGDRPPSDRPSSGDRLPRADEPFNEADLEDATGILDILPEGYGFLRIGGYLPTQEDVYVSLSQVRRFHLRRGDQIVGSARRPKESEKYRALVKLDSINGATPEDVVNRPWFERLTPLYPEERIRLELTDEPNQISQRIIDLVAPIGKGQRGMIVSPPKAGKTTVMKQIANSVRINAPDCHLIVLLVDERPEEVTDMQRSVDGEIIYSTFDRPSDDHIQVTELTLDRAKRLVEMGQDVVILLDGITRLSRAYNLATPASGRILSGGVDSTALYPPKKFFGAARNIEQGGSLTIIATALVDTGSRMDEVIFEEFKGTGNWELRLDRRASEKRIFPAIDIEASGTRKEELLLTKEELSLVWKLRRVLHALEGVAGLELLIDKMRQTKGNLQFLMEVSKQNTGD